MLNSRRLYSCILLSISIIAAIVSCDKIDQPVLDRSSENALHSFELANITASVSIKNDTVAVIVGNNVDLTAIIPLLEVSPKATVLPQSGKKQDFTVPVRYTVTAEDGTTRLYIVTVDVVGHPRDKDLLSFTVPNISSRQSSTDSGLLLSFYKDVDISRLVPIIEVSPFAQVVPKSGEMVDLSRPVTYTITAADSTSSQIVVRAENTLSSSAEILHFALEGTEQKVEFEGSNVLIYTPNNTDLSAIKTKIEVMPLALVTPSSGSVVDLTKPKRFTVRASDGTEKEYLVTVKKSPWRCLLKNGAAPFKKVDGHQTVVFKDQLYLLGGWLGSNNPINPNADLFASQVWSTENGVDWTNMGDAPWAGRHGFGCVVFKDKLWVFAGDGRLDMWSTSDGKQWTEVTDQLPFSTRYFPYVAVLNDKIVVMHGQQLYDGSNISLFTDVWASSDGTNWQQLTSVTAPVGRALICGNVVLNNQLYLIGGGVLSFAGVRAMEYNDVWVSSNGAQWHSVIKQAPFKPIYWHSIGVHNNKMYVLGGMHSWNIHTNEVWWSENGGEWTLQKYNFWLPRHAASVISFKGNLYMIGGTIDPPAAKDTQNDVWVMSGDF